MRHIHRDTTTAVFNIVINRLKKKRSKTPGACGLVREFFYYLFT